MAAALADAEKGYDSYRAILSKATDKAVKDMEKAKLDAMKKGDLASANELDARIKELKDGGLEKLVMERKKAGEDLLGDMKDFDLSKHVIGKWKYTAAGWSTILTIEQGGSVYSSNEGAGEGKWEIKGKVLRMTWLNGSQWKEMVFEKQGKVVSVNDWKFGNNSGNAERL